MTKPTKAEIEEALTADGTTLKEQVRAAWLQRDDKQGLSADEAEKGFEEHWAAAQQFLGWIADETEPIIVPADTRADTDAAADANAEGR